MSIEDYLNPSLQGIEPVRSGLAKGLEEVIRSIDEGNLTTEQLCAPELDDNLPPTVQGTINLLRVGLVHAEASGLIENSRDLLTGSFASTCMPPEMRRKADELVDEQYAVVDGYIQSGALSVELIAELGLSIGTLARLSEYVAGMPDWQLESCSRLVMRGWVDTERAKFIIIPVASRMAELEGKRMGWTVYESIIPWLNGLPLERVKSENRRFTERLENLVALIYSQLQYMLPWGLYAVDRLMEEEAQRRNITYTGDILCFAHLIDAGVPSFDALTLVHSDFERVDATRLALEYRNQGGNSLGVSITGWLGSLNNREVEAIVRGRDNRRVDSDLSTLLDAVRTMAD